MLSMQSFYKSLPFAIRQCSYPKTIEIVPKKGHVFISFNKKKSSQRAPIPTAFFFNASFYNPHYTLPLLLARLLDVCL